MQKRTFLKLSATLIAAPFLAQLNGCKKPERIKNWAGNITYSTDNVVNPKGVKDLIANVKRVTKMRTLGTRHCFNTIANSKDNLITTKHLLRILSIDYKALEVTVEPGIKYGELAPFLEKGGYALHNLASLPHISVAGACATATHGSGVTSGNLATAVTAMQIINAKGESILMTKENGGDRFNGAVVGLGLLGPVSQLTLKIEPSYGVKQDVYQNMPMESLKANFDEIMSAGYSVSLFTDWQNKNINEVWIKSKVIKKLGQKPIEGFDAKPEYFGGKLATKNLHPIAELGAENCTEQMGVPGAWYERLPHFKMGFTPSSGKELQSEFFVDRKDAYAAMMAVEKLSAKIGPLLMITEIRTIAADNLWLSTAYKRDSVAIHFTWKQEIAGVMALLPEIEAALEPFDYRPHWGKIFTMAPDKLQARYEKMADFKALVKEFDPEGKFRNEFVDKNIFG
jgi:alditol oxidase